jgi:hypothetical protein
MIVIKKCFSWYDVFVNGVMVLHHIYEQDKNDILKTATKTGDKIEVR